MEPTALLYQTDSYLREFDATVTAVQEHSVVLDRTAFYPRGGGQMADVGVLTVYGQRYAVVAVEKRGTAVVHTLEAALPDIGVAVRGTIDWEHRYHMMRTHTALHVLCGVIHREYGAHVTGCHMYPDRARMDFTLADLSPGRLDEIERLSNDAVAAGHPVRVRFLPRSEADLIPALIRTKINLVPREIDPVRIVEIVDLDVQADGGTHVANMLEVGTIRITKAENKGRENRRLEIQLGPVS